MDGGLDSVLRRNVDILEDPKNLKQQAIMLCEDEPKGMSTTGLSPM